MIGIVALLLAALWHASADYTEHRLNARHYADQNAESTQDRIERACRGVEIPALYECVAEQVAASREDQRSEYDLSAQNQMADWAFWMMIVSAVTMGIAAGALWYVKGTLDETRALTIEAQKTTAAAENALGETQKVAAAELRPWITIEAQITRFAATEKKFEADFNVTYRNIGQTVATNVWIEYLHTYLGADAGGHIIGHFKRWRERGGDSRSALIPGEYLVTPGSHSAMRDFIPWMGEEGNRRVFSVVVAAVFYRSPLDDQVHRTERSFIFGTLGEDWFDQRYLCENALDLDPTDLVVSRFTAGETT